MKEKRGYKQQLNTNLDLVCISGLKVKKFSLVQRQKLEGLCFTLTVLIVMEIVARNHILTRISDTSNV